MKSNKKLVDKIEEHIKSGQVKMKAKSHFIVKTILNILAGVLIALAATFLLSFVLFTLRINGVWLMPGLGFQGWLAFFINLPWVLILLGLLFLLSLEFFVKKYTFAYRKPAIYSVIIIILVVGLAGILVDHTPLHNQWLQKAHKHELPIAGGFYRGHKQPPKENVQVGVMQNTSQEGFELINKENQVIFVQITDKTRIFRDQVLYNNDLVMVIGQQEGDKFKAFGIRKVEQDFRIDQHLEPKHF